MMDELKVLGWSYSNAFKSIDIDEQGVEDAIIENIKENGFLFNPQEEYLRMPLPVLTNYKMVSGITQAGFKEMLCKAYDLKKGDERYSIITDYFCSTNENKLIKVPKEGITLMLVKRPPVIFDISNYTYDLQNIFKVHDKEKSNYSFLIPFKQQKDLYYWHNGTDDNNFDIEKIILFDDIAELLQDIKEKQEEINKYNPNYKIQYDIEYIKNICGNENIGILQLKMLPKNLGEHIINVTNAKDND